MYFVTSQLKLQYLAAPAIPPEQPGREIASGSLSQNFYPVMDPVITYLSSFECETPFITLFQPHAAQSLLVVIHYL